MLLSRNRSLVLVVDAQERLVPAMHEGEAVVGRIVKLLQGADLLGVPKLASEQYPKGLGPTVEPVKTHLSADAIIEKVDFPVTGAPAALERLKACDRDQIIIAGMEAHVCVLQTAFRLQERGFTPFVVADAVASRPPYDRDVAFARMRGAGIAVVTSEMVLFEWLERAGSDVFRQVSALIR